MGFTTDSKFTRNIFYIGSDRLLYQTASINTSSSWYMVNRPAADMWPSADEPNAKLTVASVANAKLTVASAASSDDVHIYYRVNGSLIEAIYDGAKGLWQTATSVPSFNSTPPAVPAEGRGGLSGGTEAGIAVGVIVFVLLVAVGALFARRRRRARREARAAAAAAAAEAASHLKMTGTPYSSPSTVAPPYSLPSPVEELDSRVRPVFEMADQLYSHEMPGEGHVEELKS